MTLRTAMRVMPLLLLPVLGLVAGCDAEHHDVEVELNVELTDEALSRVESWPALVVGAMHVVPERGRGEDFEIGWTALAILEGPDQAPSFVSGVLETGFGPCRPADVDVIVQLVPIHEDQCGEPLSEIDWSGQPFAETVLEDAFLLEERCTSGQQVVDLTF